MFIYQIQFLEIEVEAMSLGKKEWFHELEELFQSQEYRNVRRRIFRQLVESLIYENIVKAKIYPLNNGKVQFEMKGKDKDGNPVAYICGGERKMSFQRIRICDPLIRKSKHVEEEARSFSLFLEEIAPYIQADETKLKTFAEELNQTLIKDALAQYRWNRVNYRQPATYDEIESAAMEGHPYHPSYKSRIGFNLEDNEQFGPDFHPSFSLIWLGAHHSVIELSMSQAINYKEFIQSELGEDYERFVQKITAYHQDANDYYFIPVHPWQWREMILPFFFKEIEERRLILLGEGTDRYVPQQSIRTLTNRTSPEKCYVKLALSITNTSTSRILAPHTVENAAKISDWLQTIKEKDAYLKDELKIVFLREVMGISYQSHVFTQFEKEKTYGALSTIWRESIHSYLQGNEEAFPFQAMCSMTNQQRPLIDDWIQMYGLETWVKQMLNVSVTPLIHLLYAHGIAMESHAQNMILIHKNGMPTRLALKDFHDGIRFSREGLTDPALCPLLRPTPDIHARVNRNSFIETDDLSLVRDFVHDAFFFINLSEICLFLEEYYGLSEASFWKMVAEVILQYQQRFSHLAERFQLFPLFAETIQVEQLTKRRMFPETELRIQKVKNPLYVVYEEMKQQCS
jgi:2-[(L-alanin-3-ylcarbamoyl)methyl]-3-(2-aminoethylcarbamoyl)-2-hydroxypropanoate synthase